MSRRLHHLEKVLLSVNESLSEGSIDACAIHQQEEQISDLKVEFRSISYDLLHLELDEQDELLVLESKLRRLLCACSLKAKQLLSQPQDTPSVVTPGIKLPQLDIPTFDGNVLNWKSFWEQFNVSVHNRTDIADA